MRRPKRVSFAGNDGQSGICEFDVAPPQFVIGLSGILSVCSVAGRKYVNSRIHSRVKQPELSRIIPSVKEEIHDRGKPRPVFPVVCPHFRIDDAFSARKSALLFWLSQNHVYSSLISSCAAEKPLHIIQPFVVFQFSTTKNKPPGVRGR